jgi:hypothetical protein
MRNHRLRAAAGNKVQKQQFIAVGHATSPYISVYPWSSTTGFGTKFSNPSTLPSSMVTAVEFIKDGSVIALGSESSPRLDVYKFSASGFGTRYSDPGNLPSNQVNGVRFNNAGNLIGLAHASSPFVSVYPFNYSTGIGSKYANPSPELGATSAAGDLHFNINDDIAIAYDNSPYVAVYQFSGGFGSRYSDMSPVNVPDGGGGSGVRFNSSNNKIFLSTEGGSYFLWSYQWSSGFGSLSVAVTSINQGYKIGLHPTANYVAQSSSNSPYIVAIPYTSTTFGGQVSNPSTLPTGMSFGSVEWSKDGNSIAISHFSSPYVTAYSWTGSAFGSKFSNPSTLPAGNGRSLAFTEI